MTLPSFGVPLSLNQIHVEVGGTSGTTVSLNETDIRGLISKGLNASNSISDYYGASYDTVAPVLTSVSIASNNSNTGLGNVGNTVTLTFTANEAISTPTVTFLSGGNSINNSVSISNVSGNTWTASFVVHANDTKGVITFSISFSDTAGNAGTAVTGTTNSTSVSIPVAIISGDGFYYHFTMAANPASPGQPNPQDTALWIVVKLGGNIVKGSLTQYDYSTNPPTNITYYAVGPINSVFNFANASSYTDPNTGLTYYPNSQITNTGSGYNITNHFPNTNHSSNLSTYDNFGIKL